MAIQAATPSQNPQRLASCSFIFVPLFDVAAACFPRLDSRPVRRFLQTNYIRRATAEQTYASR